jgi:hypothetical protein
MRTEPVDPESSLEEGTSCTYPHLITERELLQAHPRRHELLWQHQTICAKATRSPAHIPDQTPKLREF